MTAIHDPPEHIHVLGICGTFMAGLARLAAERGIKVSGSDAGCYPPMSEVLERSGIGVSEGYSPAHLDPAPDLVVIGNALSRGNPAVEHVLDRGLPYVSGPQWLAENFLRDRWVVAVAGTHGKTTTASMVAWILEDAGLEPGFLIGGVPANLGDSARGGAAPFFVVEADEYDTAFFDKRSKFIHYRPRTLVVNNIEYDHADIFPDLAAVRTQFHHLVRTVPANGLIIRPAADPEIDRTLALGAWTPVLELGGAASPLRARLQAEDGSAFEVLGAGEDILGRVAWSSLGRHNVDNALAALAAARHAGVALAQGCRSLGEFRGVRRRLELRASPGGVHVYDDFAHHPTAIRATLTALTAHAARAAPSGRVLAILEMRSNTMRLGVHRSALAGALSSAQRVWGLRPDDLAWSLTDALAELGPRARVADSVETIIGEVVAEARAGDHVLIMSNGGFEGIQGRLTAALAAARGAGDARP